MNTPRQPNVRPAIADPQNRSRNADPAGSTAKPFVAPYDSVLAPASASGPPASAEAAVFLTD